MHFIFCVFKFKLFHSGLGKGKKEKLTESTLAVNGLSVHHLKQVCQTHSAPNQPKAKIRKHLHRKFSKIFTVK